MCGWHNCRRSVRESIFHEKLLCLSSENLLFFARGFSITEKVCFIFPYAQERPYVTTAGNCDRNKQGQGGQHLIGYTSLLAHAGPPRESSFYVRQECFEYSISFGGWKTCNMPQGAQSKRNPVSNGLHPHHAQAGTPFAGPSCLMIFIYIYIYIYLH